jgi:hypothetical protein
MILMVKRFDIPDSDGSRLTNREKLELCLKLFDQECPTEDACVDLLFDRYYPDGGKCRCGNSKVERDSGSRSFKCNYCGFITWFTAGTMFHQLKKLRPRLLYDTLLENGVSLSSSQFSRIAEIDTKTARDIFGKFMTVIESDMKVGVVAVPSRFFVDTFRRRSFVTPASEHPDQEQRAMEAAKGKPPLAAEQDSLSEPGSRRRNAIEAALNRAADLAGTLAEPLRKVYSLLLSDQPLHFDYLCNQTGLRPEELSASLTFLEMEELINRQPGDWYQRNVLPEGTALVEDYEHENSKKIDSAVGIFIKFVRLTFDGIARKYLQKYLAYFWYIVRVGEHTELLIDKCLRFGPIRQGMTRSYVTPLIVTLAA